MRLKKMLKLLPQDLVIDVHGLSRDIEITGLSSNSKVVAPGMLFIAKKGSAEDGHRYIPDAIAHGARAVVTEVKDPFCEIPQIITKDPASCEAKLADIFYQSPSRDLFLVGVTGTNGKTTTSYLIQFLFQKLLGPCGLIGTIEYQIGEQRFIASRTTPDVVTNQKLLREMVGHGCNFAVMEVTSHALEQNRVKYLDFDAAVFTNLTQDHLDYHETMEQYGMAKAKLFQSLSSSKVAVINRDSEAYDRMAMGCKACIVSYAIDADADFKASNITFSARGTQFTLSNQGKTYPIEWPLIGRFNVYNCMAALAVLQSYGIPLKEVIPHLKEFRSAPGRLERVTNKKGLNIFVDYAHTDDALSNVLKCLRELSAGRLITVFGCGGNRDKGKRPKMARVSEDYSDVTIVTSDNPRHEDPQEICNEIVQGFSKNHYYVEVDRKRAIAKAITMANPEDLILIAGKGHETYQIFAHQTVEFDDRKIASELIDG